MTCRVMGEFERIYVREGLRLRKEEENAKALQTLLKIAMLMTARVNPYDISRFVGNLSSTYFFLQ